MRKINVLSLFDGLGGGRIALQKLGIECNYYASEIDEAAIKVHKKNFPDTIHLGDVRNVKASDLPAIDLLIGGSPCQGFSFAGAQLAFNDPRSALFFEFVRIKDELKAINPDLLFMLENVKMKKQFEDVITLYMGTEPIFINSSLVSAQSRKRLYWTNIPGVTMPEDKKILLKDILQEPAEVLEYLHTDKGIEYMNRQVSGGRTHWDFSHHNDTDDDKSKCLTANIHKGVPYNVLIDRRPIKLCLTESDIEKAKEKHKAKTWKSGNRMGNMEFPDDVNKKAKCLTTRAIIGQRETTHIEDIIGIRKLTPVECERLQTIPDDYTKGVSNTERYRMIGNGWTIDVIAHIFSTIPEIARLAKAA